MERDKSRKWSNLAGVFAVVWMCVIFAFSAQPKEESSAISEGFSYQIVSSTGLLFHLHLDEEELRAIANSIEHFVRKAAHMTEYAILAILVYVWMERFRSGTLKRAGMAILFAALYAASDEIHQLFVEGRAGMISDVAIDSLGAFIGVAVFVLLAKMVGALRARREKRKSMR